MKPAVFKNCNVCGRELKRQDELAAGMCAVCANEEIDDDPARCPTCGGDGTAEYYDCPESWGEDCPSEENHLIVCPNCRGSGLLKDCSSC